MRKCLVMLNHNLSDVQLEELKKDFFVNEVVVMDEKMQKMFGHVDLETYESNLEILKEYLSKNVVHGDCVVIQGQMGYTHNLVNHLKELGAIPLFAFTKRVSVDKVQDDGSVIKTSVFQHEKFIKYR